jgi:hypothetical protein
VLAEVEAIALPRVEMGAGVDGTARTVGLTDGPVLVERGRADDRRLVDALGAEDVVRRAIGSDRAEPLRPRAGVVGAEVLDDVVLDERVGRPAIDGEIAVAARVEGAAEVDGPGLAMSACIYI